MATKTNSITFGEMSTQVSNKDDSNKQFNICGNAKIESGKFAGIEGGNLAKMDGTGNAWFSFTAGTGFNLGSNGFSLDEIDGVIKAIADFYNNVKEAVNSKYAE